MAQSPRTSRTTTASTTRSRSGTASSKAAPKTRAQAPKKTAATSAAGEAPVELRRQWIAEAAYYIAERRGFAGGSTEDDWRQAEAEIDRLLAGSGR